MDILSNIVAALKAGERVALATIVSSSGSTPLPTGSSMLIASNGQRIAGTVGGGSLEANVLAAAKDLTAGGRMSVLHEFGLNEPESADGMICGGNVDVLIENLQPDSAAVFSQLSEFREQGTDGLLLRRIDSSGLVHRAAFRLEEKHADAHQAPGSWLNDPSLPGEKFDQLVQRAHRQDRVERVRTGSSELLIQPISGIQPLIICGGGHVGRSVSKIAAATGFVVTLIDDRAEYATADRFPEAARVLAANWKDALDAAGVTSSTSIVIVTRGHQSDKEVLRLAVGTPARYIGMIGSNKKVLATFDALEKDGIAPEALKRVHAPIGLSIGAVTAEEIAVSIVAELVRERRRFTSASVSLSDAKNRNAGGAS
ncbi:MAG TPA: XdhC family protein [Bacteroidota bacterium]|nr:XdhC family protein [Bacteroidota bacterium]